jgi:hypothetical protein
VLVGVRRRRRRRRPPNDCVWCSQATGRSPSDLEEERVGGRAAPSWGEVGRAVVEEEARCTCRRWRRPVARTLHEEEEATLGKEVLRPC